MITLKTYLTERAIIPDKATVKQIVDSLKKNKSKIIKLNDVVKICIKLNKIINKFDIGLTFIPHIPPITDLRETLRKHDAIQLIKFAPFKSKADEEIGNSIYLPKYNLIEIYLNKYIPHIFDLDLYSEFVDYVESCLDHELVHKAQFIRRDDRSYDKDTKTYKFNPKKEHKIKLKDKYLKQPEEIMAFAYNFYKELKKDKKTDVDVLNIITNFNNSRDILYDDFSNSHIRLNIFNFVNRVFNKKSSWKRFVKYIIEIIEDENA